MTLPSAYTAIFEPAEDGSISVYVPDLPGCVTTGDSLAEAEQMIREAILAYLETAAEHGETVPPPSSQAKLVHVG